MGVDVQSAGGGGLGGGGGGDALAPLIDALKANTSALASGESRDKSEQLSKMMDGLGAIVSKSVMMMEALTTAIASLKLSFGTLSDAFNAAAKKPVSAGRKLKSPQDTADREVQVETEINLNQEGKIRKKYYEELDRLTEIIRSGGKVSKSAFRKFIKLEKELESVISDKLGPDELFFGLGGDGSDGLQSIQEKNEKTKELKDLESKWIKQSYDLSRKAKAKNAKLEEKEIQNLADLESKWLKKDHDFSQRMEAERIQNAEKEQKDLADLESKWLKKDHDFTQNLKRKNAAKELAEQGRSIFDMTGMGKNSKIGNVLTVATRAMFKGSDIFSRGGGGGPGGGGPGGPGPGGPGGGGGGGGGGGWGNAFGGMLGKVGIALTALTIVAEATSMAIGWLKSTVGDLIKSAANYAPAIAQAGEAALRDLEAVFGAFATPVLEAFIPIVRTVADYLFPVMQELGAAVAMVVESFAPFVRIILQVLAPIFTFVAKLLQAFMTAFQPIIGAVAVMFEFLSSTVGMVIASLTDMIVLIMSYLAPVIKWFADIVAFAADALRSFMQKIAAWTGSKNIINAVNPASTVGLAAAQSAKMGSFASLGESAVQNAFMASSGARDPSKEFAQRMMDNDVPEKAGRFLGAKPGDKIPVRKDDGWVGGAGGGGDFGGNEPAPVHGRNNAPIRMGM